MRPVVDDAGKPGYFVKEAPLVPATVAALHHLSGLPLDLCGRAFSLAIWLLGAPLLTHLLRFSSPSLIPVAFGFYLFSPLALAYSVSFQNDAAAVVASLLALNLAARWRRHPSLGRAVGLASAVALSLLLKPHAILWLGPALARLARPPFEPSLPARSAAPGALLRLGFTLALAAVPVGAWYLHAFAIHARYPVAGAMVPGGWVDPALWLDSALYLELARQVFSMVLTPTGALLCGFGLIAAARRPTALPPELQALLLWSLGVLVQSWFLGTRLFDGLARGTEYYQLALVPGLAPFVALGWTSFTAAIGGNKFRLLVQASLLATFAGFALPAARAARTAPESYAVLPELCAEVRRHTPPHAELLLLADRAGAVLYECDRRGTALVAGRAVHPHLVSDENKVPTDTLATLLRGAHAVLLPFPDLLPRGEPLRESLETGWQRIPLGQTGGLLFKPIPAGDVVTSPRSPAPALEPETQAAKSTLVIPVR